MTRAEIKAVLLIDLVDSTKLLVELGDTQAEEIFAAHDRLVRALLAEHGGQEIDKTDGFLLLFQRPIQAVRFAVAYHRRLHDLGRLRGIELKARAGIHLGEVLLRSNRAQDVARGAKPIEVEGLAKHAAARLMSLAQARQTLLSQAAFDLARRAAVGGTGGESLRWLAHGLYRYQGLDENTEVFEVGDPDFAPLSAPPATAKVKRVLADGEVILGWRAASGQRVPWRHHWRLEHKLGDGGFGEVWLAHHEKTDDRRVFKFCYAADRLRSLQREVSVFRLLKHALGDRHDIARLLDWNFEEAPYFLELEHTGGGDMVTWAESQGGIDQVPLEVRLELVAQIATALAAAHSVGVLHKDIKAKNVLISAEGGGRPKARLMDFGIGQILDAQEAANRGITMAGWTELGGELTTRGTGTRLYLAPELLEGKPPTIQSDVYALGVLLFQVVSGDLTRALAPSWRRDVDDELIAADIAACVDGVIENRPASAQVVAEHLRSLERRRQHLEKKRRARLEAERQRLAMARSRRRRRLLLTFSVLVTLFGTAMMLQARRTAHEAARASRAAQAQRLISEFLVGLFDVSDPDVARGATVTARELLDSGVRTIERALRDQPAVRAELLGTMGRAYYSLGAFEPAAELQTEALRLRRAVHGNRDPAVATALLDLGKTLRDQGDRLQAAEVHLREALALRRELLGLHDPAVSESLRAFAALELQRGRFETAEQLYGEALGNIDRFLAPTHAERGELFNDFGVLLVYRERYEDAEIQLDKAVAVRRANGEEAPSALAGTLGNRGYCLVKLGQFHEAEADYREALAIKQRLYGERHASVAITLYKMAELESARENYEEAARLAGEASEILHRELPGHWRAAYADMILAAAWIQLGRPEAAESTLLASCPVLSRHRGGTAPPTRQCLEQLVALYTAQDRPEDAERYRSLLR